MADLKDFLKQNVEGFLFYDLRLLQQPRDSTAAENEGVGYPLVMTAFAGIELLGALLSPTAFQTSGRGNIYFGSYWKNYLYPAPHHGFANGDALYQLARHGIAHAFIPKGPVAVTRGVPASHLRADANGVFCIDAVQLAIDLMDSYTSNVKPHVDAGAGDALAQTMAARLNEIEQIYRSQAAKISLVSTATAGQPALSPAISQAFAPHPAQGGGAASFGSSSGPTGPTFGPK